MKSELEEALASDGQVSRLGIVVIVLENAIVLKGTVPSYFKKQVAQERVMGVLRNKNHAFSLKNEIVVGSALQLPSPAVPCVEPTLEPRGEHGEQTDLSAPSTGQVQPH